MAANNSTIMPMIERRCANNLYLCQDSYRAEFRETTIVTAVVNGILALVASVGNGLVFAAYYHTESLRRPVFTIIMAVALTDFLTGVFSQPLFTYVLIKTLFSCPNYVCKVDGIASFFMIFFLGATILNLSVITIDRYIAVFHCYKYEQIVTNSRVVKLLPILWFSWVALILLTAFLRFATINFVLGIVMGSNIIFICILYFKIYREVQRLESNVVVPANQPNEIKKARERKSAITTGYILGALLLCFLPMVFAIFIVPLFQTMETKDRLSRRNLFLIATSCYLSNSSLNVFIYAWKNSEMKTAMMKVIRLLRQKFSNEALHP